MGALLIRAVDAHAVELHVVDPSRGVVLAPPLGSYPELGLDTIVRVLPCVELLGDVLGVDRLVPHVGAWAAQVRRVRLLTTHGCCLLAELVRLGPCSLSRCCSVCTLPASLICPRS